MPHDLRSLPNLNFMLYVLQHREKRTTNPPPRLTPAALMFCLHLQPPSSSSSSSVHIFRSTVTLSRIETDSTTKFTRSYKLLKNHVIFQIFVFLSSSSLEWRAWFSTIQLFRWSINVFLFIYFCAHIEVRGRARISTLNGTGHNTTKETVERCGKHQQQSWRQR